MIISHVQGFCCCCEKKLPKKAKHLRIPYKANTPPPVLSFFSALKPGIGGGGVPHIRPMLKIPLTPRLKNLLLQGKKRTLLYLNLPIWIKNMFFLGNTLYVLHIKFKKRISLHAKSPLDRSDLFMNLYRENSYTALAIKLEYFFIASFQNIIVTIWFILERFLQMVSCRLDDERLIIINISGTTGTAD